MHATHPQMMLKNLTDNAKNLAANAKIEDMSRLFKNQLAGGKDVKNAVSNIMVWVLTTCHITLYFVSR